jgi:hypothetical protein
VREQIQSEKEGGRENRESEEERKRGRVRRDEKRTTLSNKL